jgi:MoxR-like ATPase
MTDLETTAERVDSLRAAITALHQDLEANHLGQGEVCEHLLLCLMAGGHTLLEGAPGLGKTSLVHGMASGLDLTYRRVQFTPDLMPPDILGSRILEMEEDGSRHFSFEPGPVFTQVLLADEINRATPRTQSALLEAMQEKQVTVFGETRALEEPFMVIATQNPIEMEGTYPLPEAQLDRFLFKLTLDMPDRQTLARILELTTGEETSTEKAALSLEDICEVRRLVREVPVSGELTRLVASIVLATHPSDSHAPDSVRALVRYGASPRGGQAILLGCKARAFLKGRLHVTEADVEALAAPALRHRLILGFEGEASEVSSDELVEAAMEAARSGAA